MASRRQISEIIVLGLFGWFDHRIRLSADERITIVHGPNGVGKTTVLRLILNLTTCQFHRLRKVRFKSVAIHYTDGAVLQVTPNKNELSFEVKPGKRAKMTQVRVKPVLDESGFPLSLISRWVEPLERIGPRLWVDSSTSQHLSLEDVLEKYPEYLPDEVKVKINIPNRKLKKFLDSVDVHLIETQRLLSLTRDEPDLRGRRRDGVQYRSTVEEYAQDMANRIQSLLRRSGGLAASLDRTFPNRLLKAKVPKKATEAKIRERYAEQSKYRDRLMSAGLIDKEELLDLPDGKLEKADRKVLWHYLEDVDKKLELNENLLVRAELFQRIINEKGFLYKNFSVGNDFGFKFESDDGVEIPLAALSSGEQHELVLAYELLFKAKPGSLIMIDEPELSLHVTWQHMFLDDMEKISSLADIDFLIATHSPQIVRHRSHLMVELSGK